MVKSGHPGRISIWALGLSVFVHVLLLGTFVFLKLAEASPQTPRQYSQASLNIAQNPINEKKVYAKPKVIRAKSYTPQSYTLEVPKLEPKIKCSQEQIQNISEQSLSNMVAGQMGNFLHEVEFYGNYANSVRICFVVDASGSMQGNFRMVKARLAASINKLKPDQFFNIIFYRNGKILQLPDMDFLRASKKNKSRAIAYMNTIRPLGTTNALTAIKIAYMTASQAEKGAVVFFLTDGFELAKSDATNFISEIANYKKVLAPQSCVNTIGFNNDTTSRIILQKISEITGGHYVQADISTLKDSNFCD